MAWPRGFAATLADLELVDAAGRPLPKPTVSQGIANFPEHATEASQLLDLADGALYQAKARGRDQVCVAEPAVRPGHDEPAQPLRES